MTGPSPTVGVEPGWSSADVTPHGPGWRRYVPGKGMLTVGYENHGYHWRLQTGRAMGSRWHGGFTEAREAMKDADRATGVSAPGLFEALSAGELLALYRELEQGYQRHRTGITSTGELADELAWVRDDVFGQMEIAALDPAYNGPAPLRFARACSVAFTGATVQVMAASPNRDSWPRPTTPRQVRDPATVHRRTPTTSAEQATFDSNRLTELLNRAHDLAEPEVHTPDSEYVRGLMNLIRDLAGLPGSEYGDLISAAIAHRESTESAVAVIANCEEAKPAESVSAGAKAAARTPNPSVARQHPADAEPGSLDDLGLTYPAWQGAPGGTSDRAGPSGPEQTTRQESTSRAGAPAGSSRAGNTYTYSFTVTVPEGIEAGDVAAELVDAMDRVAEHRAIGALTLQRAPSDPGRPSLTDLDLARQPLRNWLGGNGDINVHEALGYLLEVLQAYISRELATSVSSTVDYPDDKVTPRAPARSAGAASQQARVRPRNTTQSAHRSLS